MSSKYYRDMIVFIFVITRYIAEFLLGGIANILNFFGESNYPTFDLLRGRLSTGVLEFGSWRITDFLEIIDLILSCSITLSIISWKIMVEIHHVDVGLSIFKTPICEALLQEKLNTLPKQQRNSTWVLNFLQYLPAFHFRLSYCVINVNDDILLHITDLDCELNPSTFLPSLIKVAHFSIVRIAEESSTQTDSLLDIENFQVNMLKNYDGIFQIETNCEHIFLSIDIPSQRIYLDYFNLILCLTKSFYHSTTIQQHDDKLMQKLFTRIQKPGLEKNFGIYEDVFCECDDYNMSMNQSAATARAYKPFALILASNLQHIYLKSHSFVCGNTKGSEILSINGIEAHSKNKSISSMGNKKFATVIISSIVSFIDANVATSTNIIQQWKDLEQVKAGPIPCIQLTHSRYVESIMSTSIHETSGNFAKINAMFLQHHTLNIAVEPISISLNVHGLGSIALFLEKLVPSIQILCAAELGYSAKSKLKPSAKTRESVWDDVNVKLKKINFTAWKIYGDKEARCDKLEIAVECATVLDEKRPVTQQFNNVRSVVVNIGNISIGSLQNVQFDQSLSMQMNNFLPNNRLASVKSINVTIRSQDSFANNRLHSICECNMFQHTDKWARNRISRLSAAEKMPQIEVDIDSLNLSIQQSDLRCLGGMLSILSIQSYGKYQRKHTEWKILEHTSSPYSSFLIIAKECNVNVFYVTEDSKYHRYKILREQTLVVKHQSLGSYWSELNVYCDKDIFIKYFAPTNTALVENANDDGKLLVKVTIPKPNESLQPSEWVASKAVVTMKTGVSESFWEKVEGIGLGYGITALYVSLQDVSVCVDVQDIAYLLKLISCFSSSFGNKKEVEAMQRIHGDIGGSVYINEYEIILPREFILPQPTFVQGVTINRCRITLLHLYKAILSTTMKPVEFMSIAFGDELQQICLNIQSVKIKELSSDKAVHKTILNNLGKNVNKINLHLTSKRNEKSLLEIYGEYLQGIFLMRSILTIISFVRDYFLADIFKNLCDEPLISVSESDEVAESRISYLPYDLIPEYAAKANALENSFRFSLTTKNSEVHFPLSSCGKDALVFLLQHIFVYHATSYLKQYHVHEYKEYCYGPLITEKVWLSESNNIKAFLKQTLNESILFYPYVPYVSWVSKESGEPSPRRVASVPSHSRQVEHIYLYGRKWILPQLAKLLKSNIEPSPIETSFNKLTDTNNSLIEIELYGATICSWCSQNLISLNQDMKVSIDVRTALPATADAAEVFDDETYDTLGEYLSSYVIVEVNVDSLQWILSQGQYWAIINLILQNFMELQEHVIEIYPTPPLRIIDITENVYGKYALNPDYPLITKVPVNIKFGTIICIENESSFYDNYILDLPEPELITPTLPHNFSEEFHNSIPPTSHHHYYTQKFLTRWNGSRSQEYAPKSKTEMNIQTDAPFCIIMHDFCFNFYRKYFGDGNGIEVTALSMVVLAAPNEDLPHRDDDDNTDFDMNNNNTTLDNVEIDEDMDSLPFSRFTVEQAIFAPKSNSFLQRARNKSDILMSAIADDDPRRRNYSSTPHVRYTQEGVENLRRCVIEVHDSAVVAHLISIMALVDYFYTPVRVNGDRNIKLIETMGVGGPYDYKVALDFELHLKNTAIGLPNIFKIDTTGNIGFKRKETANKAKRMDSSRKSNKAIRHSSMMYALWLEFNHVDYVHAWRGFLVTGPGSSIFDVKSQVLGTYIAPVNEIQNYRSMQTLVDSVNIEFHDELRVLPNSELHRKNYGLLKPWINFSPNWINEHPNSFARSRHSISPMEHRVPHLILEIRPAEKVVQKFDDYLERKDENDNLEEDSRIKSITNVADVSRKKHFSLNDDESVQSGLSSAAGKSNNNNLAYTDKREKYAESLDKIVHGQLSLKDVEFMLSVFATVKYKIERNIKKLPLNDPFADICQNVKDIQHIPSLLYYLVHTDAIIETRTDKKEFIGKSCDFEFIIRNNTYNVNIVKYNLQNIFAKYVQAPKDDSMTAGVKIAFWSFNDDIDDWEPLIEPINLQAKGSTDLFTQKDGFHLNAETKIRINVITDHLEINAPQMVVDNLIKKCQLADVVTTSSGKLPPYKVVNHLGTDITYYLGLNELTLLSGTILTDEILPFEMSQLATLTEKFKRKKQQQGAFLNEQSTTNKSGMIHPEYFLSILFKYQLNQAVYKSITPLSMDKIGLSAYDMKLTKRFAISTPTNDVGIGTNTEEEGKNNESTSSTSNMPKVNRPRRFSVFTDNRSTAENSQKADNKEISTIPYTILDMNVRDDGNKELHLRSIFSFKNITSQTIYLGFTLHGKFCSVSLFPRKEWNVPLDYCHPKSHVYIRLSDKHKWYGINSTLNGFISGIWGKPVKLRSKVCIYPYKELENLSTDDNNSNHGTGKVKQSSWTALFRPVAKSINHQKIVKALPTFLPISSSSSIPLKYPTKDTFFNPNQNKLISDNPFEGITGIQNISNLRSTISSTIRNNAINNNIIRPVCVYIQAPLQLNNLLPQPILYRVIDKTGNIHAAGVILPGQIIDIHNLPSLFLHKSLISIRLINYGWSSWTTLFNKSNPFIINERNQEISLQSLNFATPTEHDDEIILQDFALPSLVISMSQKEYFVKFSCPILLCNSTGLELYFADASNTDHVLPMASEQNIAEYMIRKREMRSHRSSMARSPTINARTYFAEDQNDEKTLTTSEKPFSSTKAQHMASLASFHLNNQYVTPMSRSKFNLEQELDEDYEDENFDENDNEGDEDSVEDESDQDVIDEDDDIEEINVEDTFKATSASDALGKGGEMRSPRFSLFRKSASTTTNPGYGLSSHHKSISAAGFKADKVKLMLYSPFDHCKNAEFEVRGNMTLSEFFSSKLRRNKSICIPPGTNIDQYVFLPYVQVKDHRHRDLDVKGDDDDGDDFRDDEESVHQQYDQHAPTFMKFDMVVDLNHGAIPINRTFESIQPSKGNESTKCIILCHISEYKIAIQANSIKSVQMGKQNGTMFKSIFSRNKYTHRATFSKIEGYFPFRPQKLLGFNSSSLCIKVPNETEWSGSIDVLKVVSAFHRGDITIPINAKQVKESDSAGGNAGKSTKDGSSSNMTRNPLLKTQHYEFGAYFTYGSGLLQNTAIVTFVPKHIIVSGLSFPVAIRPIMYENSPSSTLQNGRRPERRYDHVIIPSHSSRAFHFSNINGNKLFQLRKSDTYEINNWYGELDISTLGIVYLKLKNPFVIIKAETELIGASLVVRLQEQSQNWPPYRIDNMTDYTIRFRQQVIEETVPAVNTGNSAPTSHGPTTMMENIGSNIGHMVTASAKTLTNLSEVGGNNNNNVLTILNKAPAWDVLPPHSTCSYGWDYPLSERRLIALEVSSVSIAGNHQWMGNHSKKVIGLDSENKIEVILVNNIVPNLGNPVAEGEANFRTESVSNSLAAAVSSAATATATAAIPIDFSWTKCYCILRPDMLYIYDNDRRNQLIDIINLAYTDQSDQVKLCMVTRYIDRSWDIVGTTVGLLGVVAQGVVTTVTGGIIPIGNNNKAKKDTVNYDVNAIRILMLLTADYLGLLCDCTVEMFIKPKNEDEENSNKIIKKAESSDLYDYESDGEPSALKRLLKRGVNMEQLLSEIEKYPVKVCDLLDAVIHTKQIDEEKGRELLWWMFTEGFLQAPDHALLLVSEVGKSHSFQDTDDATIDEERSFNGSTRRPSLNGSISITSVNNDNTTPRTGRRKQINSAGKNQNNGIPSGLNRRKHHLHGMENSYVYFRPPPLNPEMIASLTADDQSVNNKQESTDELYGITIIGRGPKPNDNSTSTKYHFKFSSETEYFGWIQSARQAIELSWIDCYLKRPKKFLKVSDFQTNILMKIRADGSTKVLEVIQQSENDGLELLTNRSRGILSNASNLILGKKSKRRFSHNIAAASSILPLFRENNRLVNSLRLQNLAEAGATIDREQELVEVAFNIDGVSLSLIDAEPLEVCYIRLHDVEMNVVRYFDTVQFSVTVQDLQVSNQSLNPTFPVAIFPRQSKTLFHRRLVLPGLNPATNGKPKSPTLHLYMQQRYHKTMKPEESKVEQIGTIDELHNTTPSKSTETKDQNNEEGDRLWYFDVFSFYAAPLQVALDEELIVRVLRYIQAVKLSLEFTNEAQQKEKRMFIEEIPLMLLGSVIRLKDSDDSQLTSLNSELDHDYVFHQFQQFLGSNKTIYLQSTKSSLHIYFSYLTLYPLDVTLHFRPSQDIQISNSEAALLSVISQLDTTRICLNALFAEHAFGSTSIISEILMKHYRVAFWKQLQKLITTGITAGVNNIATNNSGNTANAMPPIVDDINEDMHGGLLANLGSGTAVDYDYETLSRVSEIEGSLLANINMIDPSFYVGMATKAIVGGTSAVTSQITGGLSNGVSMLTLDSEFQRHRMYRRLNNKTSTVSEGLYVGTQELGKNIMEGVTGIVVNPIRGWEQGGGVGFGVGVAKGLLGVALKPAVGVLDLASRATEGLRNTALNEEVNTILQELQMIHRARIPRAFGRAGLLKPYDPCAAAVQYMLDRINDFKSEPRMMAIAHLYNIRTVANMSVSLKDANAFPRDHDSPHINTLNGILCHGVVVDELVSNIEEVRGLKKHHGYLIVLCSDRIALMQITTTVYEVNTNEAAAGGVDLNVSPLHTNSGGSAVRASTNEDRRPPVISISTSISSLSSSVEQKIRTERKLLWTCPINCITELFSDRPGDIILCINPSYQFAVSSTNNNNNNNNTNAPVSSTNDASSITAPSIPTSFSSPTAASTLSTTIIPSSSVLDVTTTTTTEWNQSIPIILDRDYANYLLFQSLLEQTIGIKLARLHPLHPTRGLLKDHVQKRYTSRLKSYLFHRIDHIYRLYGGVLYEYSYRGMEKKDRKSSKKNGKKVDEEEEEEDDEEENILDREPSPITSFRKHARGMNFGTGIVERTTSDDHVFVEDVEEEDENENEPEDVIEEEENENEGEEDEMEEGRSQSSSITENRQRNHPDPYGDTHGMIIHHGERQQQQQPLTMSSSFPMKPSETIKASTEEFTEHTIVTLFPSPPPTNIIPYVHSATSPSQHPATTTTTASSSPLKSFTRWTNREHHRQQPPSPERSVRSSTADTPSASASAAAASYFPTSSSPTRPRRQLSHHVSSTTSSPDRTHQSNKHRRSRVPTQPGKGNDLQQEGERMTLLSKDTKRLQNTYLSFIYPLVCCGVSGPNAEENGKYYSITISRRNAQRIRCLKRDDDQEIFTEYQKRRLSIMFTSKSEARQWRRALEEHMIQQPDDCIPAGPLILDEKDKPSAQSQSQRLGSRSIPVVTSKTIPTSISHHATSTTNITAMLFEEEVEIPPQVFARMNESILYSLVLPTSGLSIEEIETMKTEISNTLSAIGSNQ